MSSLARARKFVPHLIALPLLAAVGCGGSELAEDPLFNDQQAAVQRVDEDLKQLRSQVEEMNRLVSNLLTEVENLKGEPLTGSVAGPRLDERVAVLETAMRESNQTLSEVRNEMGLRAVSSAPRTVTPAPSRSNDAPDVAPAASAPGSSAAESRADAVASSAPAPAPAATRVTLQLTPAPPKPAATPKPAPKPAQGFYHVVRHGETLSTIAAQYGVSAESIRRENRIPEGRQPIPGQQIYIVR